MASFLFYTDNWPKQMTLNIVVSLIES